MSGWILSRFLRSHTAFLFLSCQYIAIFLSVIFCFSEMICKYFLMDKYTFITQKYKNTWSNQGVFAHFTFCSQIHPPLSEWKITSGFYCRFSYINAKPINWLLKMLVTYSIPWCWCSHIHVICANDEGWWTWDGARKTLQTDTAM